MAVNIPIAGRNTRASSRENGHLASGILLGSDAEKIGSQAAEIPVVEAVDQVLEQCQHQQQRHDTGLAELQ